MYKKPSIGAVRLDGWALLAPMAGVSDLAYRVIAHRMGAALTTAEMVSAKGLYYKNEKTEDMLKIDPGEHPVALQLFGSDPEIMALGAKEMEKAGPDIIDINMGCPMQKVVKNGDGSALMKNIPLAQSIVKAMTEAVHVPVTVKMKLKDDPPKAALAAMIADDRKQKYPILPKGLSVNTVKVKDGIATVDFSKELLNMDKSTTTEELFTAMTVNTLTEFPDIKEVKFLMNGKAITHLSGHSDMTRTFKRMNTIIKK